ncbi:hypothetical protein ART_3791 [Arthrobacter sp. PAMC 25486]|nr:hypothetical protein ART_3791 [Arthrobacter sp. PAMC 25486]
MLAPSPLPFPRFFSQGYWKLVPEGVCFAENVPEPYCVASGFAENGSNP